MVVSEAEKGQVGLAGRENKQEKKIQAQERRGDKKKENYREREKESEKPEPEPMQLPVKQILKKTGK